MIVINTTTLILVILFLLFMMFRQWRCNAKMVKHFDKVTKEFKAHVDHVQELSDIQAERVEQLCLMVKDRLDEDSVVHDKTHRLIEDILRSKV